MFRYRIVTMAALRCLSRHLNGDRVEARVIAFRVASNERFDLVGGCHGFILGPASGGSANQRCLGNERSTGRQGVDTVR
jgi:hypothetical protein